MALNVYWESRGEPIDGQYGVANVTLNRAKTPDNVCQVVVEKRQFSWVGSLVENDDGQPRLKPAGYPKDKQAWRLAWRIANDVINNPRYDFTKGSTHFHTTNASPQWRHSATRTMQLGSHIFYRMI